MNQVAVIPYRIVGGGEFQVMLITSRRSRRWVIPKGNPIKGVKPYEAASREAFEEAGLIGTVSKKPIGKFVYQKRKDGREPVWAEVAVYPMRVTDELEDWPERRQRQRRWLSTSEASRLAGDASLRRLLLLFHLNRGAPAS